MEHTGSNPTSIKTTRRSPAQQSLSRISTHATLQLVRGSFFLTLCPGRSTNLTRQRGQPTMPEQTPGALTDFCPWYSLHEIRAFHKLKPMEEKCNPRTSDHHHRDNHKTCRARLDPQTPPTMILLSSALSLSNMTGVKELQRTWRPPRKPFLLLKSPVTSSFHASITAPCIGTATLLKQGCPRRTNQEHQSPTQTQFQQHSPAVNEQARAPGPPPPTSHRHNAIHPT